MDIETIIDLEEATDRPATKVSNSTEHSTLSMSCVHGFDVEDEVSKPGLAMKPEDVSTSVANLDDKKLLKCNHMFIRLLHPTNSSGISAGT